MRLVNIFLPFHRLPFHFAGSFLWCAEAFYFDVVKTKSLADFCFGFWRQIQKLLPRPMSRSLTLKQTNFIYLNKNFNNLKFQCALKKGINLGTHRNETNITKYVNTSFLIMLRKSWVHIYYN